MKYVVFVAVLLMALNCSIVNAEDLVIEPGAYIIEEQVTDELLHMAVSLVRAEGYVCTSVSGIGARYRHFNNANEINPLGVRLEDLPSGRSPNGIVLSCNGYRYLYRVEDLAGQWEVVYPLPP